MNFSFGQQYSPQQQQQYQPNTQFNQANFVNQQQEWNRMAHLEAVKLTLEKLFQLQNQTEFQQLIQHLQGQQKISKQHLQKTIDQSEVKLIEPQKMDEMFKKGQNIKQRNAALLNKLLLVKAKLERMMYHDMNPHSRYEYETSVAMDKIRTLKSQITQKCTYLKTMTKPSQRQERRSKEKSANFSNIGTALTEMKKGAEVLERQVLKQKTEMELVVKYLNEGI